MKNKWTTNPVFEQKKIVIHSAFLCQKCIIHLLLEDQIPQKSTFHQFKHFMENKIPLLCGLNCGRHICHDFWKNEFMMFFHDFCEFMEFGFPKVDEFTLKSHNIFCCQYLSWLFVLCSKQKEKHEFWGLKCLFKNPPNLFGLIKTLLYYPLSSWLFCLKTHF